MSGDSKPRSVTRTRIWVILGVLIVLAVVAVGLLAAKHVYDQAVQVRDHLLAAMSHGQEVQRAVIAGEREAAASAAASMSIESTSAVAASRGRAWNLLESLPFGATENLRATRIAAEVTNQLVTDVVTPLSGFDAQALIPSGGGIDLESLSELAGLTDQVDKGLDTAKTTLNDVNRGALLAPVADGIGRLDDAIARLSPIVSPLDEVLEVLPAALGAETPKNYLVMFQGNSEARSLGGNPAVFLVLHAEGGALTVRQHADSSDFKQALTEPIVSLDPEAVAIYGDKIGRWTPDLSMVPDFPTAAHIMRAHWATRFDTQVDGVLSFDPVALSYLLAATGPVTLPSGDVLSAANAVAVLLNGVYFRYDDIFEQNAFFASATDAIFGAIVGGNVDPVSFISAFTRSAEEGRLLYQSSDPRETELMQHSRLSGVLPADNSRETVVGAYVNDNTGSKKSYYLDTSISAATDRCTAEESPAFSGKLTVTSNLNAAEAARLPRYIAGPNFSKEDISTYVVIYGPVASSLESVLLDGQPAATVAQGTHLGRPVVKIEVLNHLESSHSIDFVFRAAEQDGNEMGPLSVRTTPMVRGTSVTVSDPSCG